MPPRCSARRRPPSSSARFALTKRSARRSVNRARRPTAKRAPPTEAAMAAERKDQHPADAWSDIPDPLHGMPQPPAPSIKVPATPSATRAQVLVQRFVFLGAALIWPVVVLFYYDAGWRGHGIDYVAAQFALWAMLLLFAAWLALSAGRRGIGRPVPWLRIAAVG